MKNLHTRPGRPTEPALPDRRRMLGASSVALAALVPGLVAGCAASAGKVAVGGLGSENRTAELLDSAIAGPQRSAANRARDVYRHPKETLIFFGLRPGMSVIEIAPGGGWYTEILAPVLRDQGRLYEATYAKDSPSAEERHLREIFDRKMASDPGLYGKVVVGTMPETRFTDIAPPLGADMVLTFRNIHNWIEAGHLDTTLRAFFDVLRPGGVLGVEEHRAAPGTSLERIVKTGYVPEAYVIEHCQAAGFRLDGRSEINANPRDTKDYEKGVWTLPPTFRNGQVDRARYAAIGESDRMTLRFRKPLA